MALYTDQEWQALIAKYQEQYPKFQDVSTWCSQCSDVFGGRFYFVKIGEACDKCGTIAHCPSTHGGSGYAPGTIRIGKELAQCGICGQIIQYYDYSGK